MNELEAMLASSQPVRFTDDATVDVVNDRVASMAEGRDPKGYRP